MPSRRDYAGTLSNTRVNTQSTAHATGVIIVRGTAVQTVSGTLDIEKDIAIGGSATLRLAGTASLNAQVSGSITLNGGTLTLDNATINIPSRLRDGDSGSNRVDVIGRRHFFTRGQCGGHLRDGRAAATRLGQQAALRGTDRERDAQRRRVGGDGDRFPILFARQGAESCNTVNFAGAQRGRHSARARVAGNNPRIIFNTTIGSVFTVPLSTACSAIPASANSTTVGWATVNGTGFATHTANGIAAVAIDATRWRANRSRDGEYPAHHHRPRAHERQRLQRELDQSRSHQCGAVDQPLRGESQHGGDPARGEHGLFDHLHGRRPQQRRRHRAALFPCPAGGA